MRHADRPFVVFHHKQDRQLPERRHIQALKKLSVVSRAIAKESSRDLIRRGIAHRFPPIFALESGSERHGDAFANERIAAQQPMLG